MEEINLLYNRLLEDSKPKYGATHGLQRLHQGKKVNEKSILFIGRENRGHGNFLNGFTEPVHGFIKNDFGWLNSSYRFTKSPFWRVIGKSLGELTGEKYNVDIYENIYWTNLYKVSPSARKPNTHKVRLNQADICKDLLKEEIKFLEPKAVVFLTDDWIWPFLNSWENENFISTPEREKSLPYFNLKFNFYSTLKKIPAIVLPHPQNKKSGAREEDLVYFISSELQA